MDKKQVFRFVFGLILAATTSATANDMNLSFKKKVESSRVRPEHLALIIGGHDGDTLYAHNEKKPMIPASLTKIATAGAVLENFPVGYQFVTELLFRPSQVQRGELNGDLYLRGGGDATFVSESMWFLVNEFLRNDIKKINGNLVVDDSRFDDIRFDSSRDQDRVDRAYDAPIGAMTFNWSAVNIFVRPGVQVGDPARVYADPTSPYIKIESKVKTVDNSKKTEVEVTNAGLSKGKDFETIVLRGQISLASKEFVAYKSVAQPDIWAGQQLRQFLAQRGVQVSGAILRGATPNNVVVGAAHKSKAIGEIVSDMMKFSNNYIAEILTKNLAVQVFSKKGTMEDGVKVIQEYLSKNGLTDFEIYNPSGLSRKNRFRAQDLLAIQRRIKSQFGIYPEYLSGLPIAGVDGTLKRRLKDTEFQGRVRAKTGHLSGVSGLSGFVSDRAGNAYPFVFMYNGPADNAPRAHALFDQLLSLFLNEYEPISK